MTDTTHYPNDDNDRFPAGARDSLEPGMMHTSPDQVAASSASRAMPVRFAAQRQVWTVVAIVVIAVLTLVAFGALIWQALQPI